jgi:hypothetical protein
MSLLAEHIPEHDRAGLSSEIVDLKLLRTLDDFRVVCPSLAQAGEIAFDVGHENRHATRTEIFRQGLQRHRFARTRGASDQAVAIRHFRQQKNRLLGLRDENGFGHDLNYDFANEAAIVQRRPQRASIERAIDTLVRHPACYEYFLTSEHVKACTQAAFGNSMEA